MAILCCPLGVGLWRQLGRIRVRLLVVNLVVVLVPVAGLEFADLYERQLLGALERDMRNQAVVTRRFLEANFRHGVSLDAPQHEEALRDAAEKTRTRIRLLDRSRHVVVDSHRGGPPEGPEPPAPQILGSSATYVRGRSPRDDTPWPVVPRRREIREAFAGQRSSYTRVRQAEPAVFLFVTEPILPRRRVAGVVYVVRSTTPVLVELYRIRRGLVWVLGAAVVFTLLVSLALAWSISRPLARLSKAAKRIAAGERDVDVPVGGGGEIRELGESFAAMTSELGARMRYISEFSADVAHEFKTPLTSMRGAAELLVEGAAEDPEARKKFLGNILLDVDRLDRHVSRLLELSRIEAAANTARGVVALQPLVEAVANRSSTPEHEVLVEWEASAPLVEAREMDIETAMGNLIDNALRVSPPGAPVRVIVRDGTRRADEEFSARSTESLLRRAPGWIQIAVEDAGPGVPVVDRERIFDRFFTTEGESEGTGLGLAIVRAVMEAHGGRVYVEDGDVGARFVLELPVMRRLRRV